jgi:hypothetical protein
VAVKIGPQHSTERLNHSGKPVELVTIDSRLDFGADPEDSNSRNFMNDIILHEPNYLFDYTNIGHQGYLTDPDTLELLEKDAIHFHSIGVVQWPALIAWSLLARCRFSLIRC